MTLRAPTATLLLVLVACLCTLCCGCRTSALLTPAKLALVESKHAVNTRQHCQWSQELADATDATLQCLVREMAAAGRLDAKRALADLRDDPPWVCLVDQPEPCGWGPCADNYRCQRRAGCTYWGSSVWVARWWPPRCSPDWPQEGLPPSPGIHRVGCVDEGPQREVWRSTLAKELMAVLTERQRLGAMASYVAWATKIQRGCTP